MGLLRWLRGVVHSLGEPSAVTGAAELTAFAGQVGEVRERWIDGQLGELKLSREVTADGHARRADE